MFRIFVGSFSSLDSFTIVYYTKLQNSWSNQFQWAFAKPAKKTFALRTKNMKCIFSSSQHSNQFKRSHQLNGKIRSSEEMLQMWSLLVAKDKNSQKMMESQMLSTTSCDYPKQQNLWFFFYESFTQFEV